MNTSATFELSEDRTLAYHKLIAQGDGSRVPGLIFLGGFKSNMNGTKARFLEDWAHTRGLAFLRFDYRGHGESSGAFEDGCIGDWADDAAEILMHLTDGPQILVGSSMGGWIALLLAKRFPHRVTGLIALAAAPDFTTRRWEDFTEAQRDLIQTQGQIQLPSQYDEAPYIYTRKLFEDGLKHRVLTEPLDLPFPVHLLHGMADPDVPWSVSVELLRHVTCKDARLTLIKHGDHRLSEPSDLGLLGQTVDEMVA